MPDLTYRRNEDSGKGRRQRETSARKADQKSKSRKRFPGPAAARSAANTKHRDLRQPGEGHQAQPCLGLLGQVGQNHGDMVAGVFIPCAGNDNTRAVHFPIVTRRQSNRHFRPWREGRGGAKLDAIFMNDDRVR